MHNPISSNQIYLICPIGLEKTVRRELETKWQLYFKNFSYKIIEQSKGGIELETEILEVAHLNQILKTPTRILLRCFSFKCRDFPKLFNKIKKYNWSPYIFNENFEIVASSKKSRLINTKKIETSVSDGIKKWLHANPRKKTSQQITDKLPPLSIYVRLINDECIISIDTSGDPLFKRNERLLKGPAPIRENLAASLFYELTQYIPKAKINYHLIDPMCGSGTLLFEAFNFNQLNNNRIFTYQFMPLFKNIAPILSPVLNQFFIKEMKGFEKNKKSFEAAKRNLENLKSCSTYNIDYLDSIQTNDNNIIISNPPYGKRIKLPVSPQIYFNDLIEQIEKAFRPVLIGIIAPEYISIKHNNLIKELFFVNGGFKVKLLIIKN